MKIIKKTYRLFTIIVHEIKVFFHGLYEELKTLWSNKVSKDNISSVIKKEQPSSIEQEDNKSHLDADTLSIEEEEPSPLFLEKKAIIMENLTTSEDDIWENIYNRNNLKNNKVDLAIIKMQKDLQSNKKQDPDIINPTKVKMLIFITDTINYNLEDTLKNVFIHSVAEYILHPHSKSAINIEDIVKKCYREYAHVEVKQKLNTISRMFIESSANKQAMLNRIDYKNMEDGEPVKRANIEGYNNTHLTNHEISVVYNCFQESMADILTAIADQIQKDISKYRSLADKLSNPVDDLKNLHISEMKNSINNDHGLE